MSDWFNCPGCGLKHSRRPDGRCPRCGAATGPAPTATAAAIPANPYAPPQHRVELPIPISTFAGSAREIAITQRKLLMGFVLGYLFMIGGVFGFALLANVVKELAPFAMFLVVPGVYGFFIHNGYRAKKLANALNSGASWGWAIGCALPGLIGLIAIAMLSRRATARLKETGVRVGFLGVSPDDLPPA